ncbi:MULTISPECIES: hypothetical protein [unclassified Streptomyces]|uniref:hypothetical protein n=1 Tax=unclassified Streptomyces TaxID=2593676 RepID=UPI002DD8F11F|nr:MULTISPECIES: hypothetical protein [unclassified Streptomyces]WSS46742.1 hypothetical protein OG220_39870 [Streptomyces sp. NBC_01187]WSA97741.1 hypothetical protein OIE63_40350 [Streptomyces sp. NBC_01795]WSB82008.1 hypothetical protein OHB04_40455 [Streptomyces sp. NBC_01775]WSS17983.1 hypothetical protein OG533_39560 [Streptomyces sp. NBC_01186]WSS47041.1 hypothetical protein OG220_41755 [Streptomyces sp. NBC_01187]
MINRFAVSVTMLALAFTDKWEAARAEMQDRADAGEIAVSTVIIWAAAIGGAIAIAATITAVIMKANGKLESVF